MEWYKQAILVRQDLKLTRGKMSAQVSHASVEAALRSHKDDLQKWRQEGMKKIVLKVADKKQLLAYKQRAEDAGLVVAVITDAGKTHIAPGTVTCLGIGPDVESKIDDVCSDLQLMG